MRIPLEQLGEARVKLETGLPTGSFKVRGAIYALSTHLRAGVLAEVSAGRPSAGASVALVTGGNLAPDPRADLMATS